MKWALYFAAFFAIFFFSFWGYAWIYRVEFAQTALERSCPPYKVSIGTIEIVDSQTVDVQNLSIFTKEASSKRLVHISRATLSSPTTSWIFWLLSPSTKPLHLRTATLTVPQCSHLSFEHPSLHLPLSIDTLTVDDPNGRLKTYQQLQGPVAAMLNTAIE
jgi:hypothetical protein